MLEDKILVWKLNRGSGEALSRIYEKYRSGLLRLAVALSNDKGNAEDVVQDVFLRFADSAGSFQLTGSLKGYFATCVVNRVRNANFAKQRRRDIEVNNIKPAVMSTQTPEKWIANCEELERISSAIAELKYEQREAITLHLYGGLKFREIAQLQQVPIKTVQSRYRIGLDKLRSMLKSEVRA